MTIYTRCLKLHNILYTNVRTIQFCTYYNSKIQSSFMKKYSGRTKQSLNHNVNEFHLCSVFLKRRKTAEEKKSDRLIEYSPKSKAEIVDVWRNITIAELASILNSDLQYVYDLFLNQVRDPNAEISDIKLLQLALKRGGRRMRVIGKPKNDIEEVINKDAFPRPPPAKADLKPRPPVVTIMGHVDHGKTTLLDALRHSSVVDQEFGGITQHIGAFSVVLDSGAKITFLDTPGHAAFSAMRARGANLTDIVVLVVAADDGVMEQTVESVKMAKQANVPILVAINKIDSSKADIERTENMLLEIGIQVERLGGDIQAVPISALKKQNLEKLTEALILQAELLEIGADPTGLVEAVVVESNVHPHRGKLCTLVVQRGTLKKGDILVGGTSMARVRTLKDSNGKIIQKVPPGYPVEVEGWKDLPSAGDQILQVESEKRAREVIKVREDLQQLQKLDEDAKVINQKQEQHEKEYKEKLQLKRRLGRFKMKREGPRKPEIIRDENAPPSLNVVLKTDVDGTLEAILDVLDSYESDECKLDLVHYGVGAITQNDIELAKTFNGIVYGFNAQLPSQIKHLAEEANVDVRHHNVIYKLIDDLKEEINKRLLPKEVEDILGEAIVLQQFEINEGKRKVPVAGCRCDKGILKRSALYKVVRNGEIIHTGPLSSMRHLKSEVDVIKSDTECGLQLADKTITFEKGDVLICFENKVLPQKTDWNPGF